MKLLGKVVRIESGSLFRDKTDRVLVKLDGEIGVHTTLELRNEDGWKLNDEVELDIFAIGQAATDAITALELELNPDDQV